MKSLNVTEEDSRLGTQIVYKGAFKEIGTDLNKAQLEKLRFLLKELRDEKKQ